MMAKTNDGPVPVKQEDRDAAGRVYGRRGNPSASGACRRGERDSDPLVQDFARHRLAALASAPADVTAAVRGVTDDFMTSEAHHPGYVLIPTERFDMLRKAEASLASAAGEVIHGEQAEQEARQHGADSFGGRDLNDAPAGDGVDLQVVGDAVRYAKDVLTQVFEGRGRKMTGTTASNVNTAAHRLGDALAAFDCPRAAVGEQSREWWVLEWIGAPRPPVHPNPMNGKQSFATAEKALAFWRKQPADATYVSLTKHTETIELQSLPAKVEGECPSSPDGRHQVDTTMESGSNNCFHCEARMGGAA